MLRVIHGNNQTDATPSLPLSPAIQAGDYVFLSAQFSADEQGNIVDDTIAGETNRTFANVRRLLRDAGLDLSDIVQVRCYLAERGDVAEFNRVYAEIFSAPFPVRTTLAGCLPCDGKIAVDVVAYAGSEAHST